MKICTTCHIPQILEAFTTHHGYKGGRRTSCRSCETVRATRAVQALRHEIIDALGGECLGCGIMDRRVLVFDHIHGGGNAERKGTGPTAHYRRVLRELDRFQLLCHNCNYLKRLERGEHATFASRALKVMG